MRRILIIEDEEILLKVLVDRFTEAGWEVVSANNGDSASEIIAKESALSIVLLDLLLPQKSGLLLLKEIRATEALKEVPVIVLSNLGDAEDIQKAMHLGATNFFIKTQHPISEILEEANKYAK